MSDDYGETTDQPREVRRGHLSQWRAGLRDDRVEVVIQPRMHRFGSGTQPTGRQRRIWSGSLDEAEQLYEILGALLEPDENEVNYAWD